MENYVSGEYKEQEQHIKEYLKTVVSEDVYDKWIENLVFEYIGNDKIIAGYYGDESLAEFKKNYKEYVWVNICSVIGYVKKFEIYDRRSKLSKLHNIKSKKWFKAAKLFCISLIFAAVALSLAVVAGNYIGNRNFKETFYSVSSLKADNEIRIIQISDLHNCKYGRDNVKLTSRIKKLNPDLILLTGDCINSSDASTDNVTELCKTLVKSAPTYYIYGNNEVKKYYDTSLSKGELDKKYGFNDKNRNPKKLLAEKDDFEKKLEKAGVKVLKNEFDTIVIGSTEVDVYGVLTSNPSAFWPYAGESFGEYIYNNLNNLKITAIHEPFIFEKFKHESWGDLMVCGHTHGGVVRLPIFGPLYTHEGGLLPEKNGDYVYGRYEVEGSPLIISSGLENRNIFRINNRPELVIIDVNKF